MPPANQVSTLTAKNPETGDQVTRYVYGTTLAGTDVCAVKRIPPGFSSTINRAKCRVHSLLGNNTMTICTRNRSVASSLLLTLGLTLGASTCVLEAAPPAVDRWEGAIRAFEKADAENPPEKGGVLFIGSSSIRMWDLPRYFPDLAATNRGFGGSQVADSLRYADRILLPYAPRTVVLYAGDNDVAAGKSPEQVADDFRRFVEKVHGRLPDTRVVYIAIKPSLARWKLVEPMRRANRLIHDQTEKSPHLAFVDVDGPMIGADGKPRRELFLDDGLHLNDAGYRLWTSLVRPALGE